jgi:hypothetical protein
MEDLLHGVRVELTRRSLHGKILPDRRLVSATSASPTPHAAKLGPKVKIHFSVHSFLKHSNLKHDPVSSSFDSQQVSCVEWDGRRRRGTISKLLAPREKVMPLFCCMLPMIDPVAN